jgi:hypothetical protein
VREKQGVNVAEQPFRNLPAAVNVLAVIVIIWQLVTGRRSV